MSAPELLTLFREETAGKGWEKIRINVSDLDYISSAGLRVLLIMMKEKPGNGSVTLCNLKPDVRNIFEATGFDRFFLKQV